MESQSNSRKEESLEKHTTIAVDLAKTVFEITVSDRPGRVCERKRLRHGQMDLLCAATARHLLLEACGSAHHCSPAGPAPRGHRVLLLPRTRRAATSCATRPTGPMPAPFWKRTATSRSSPGDDWVRRQWPLVSSPSRFRPPRRGSPRGLRRSLLQTVLPRNQNRLELVAPGEEVGHAPFQGLFDDIGRGMSGARR